MLKELPIIASGVVPISLVTAKLRCIVLLLLICCTFITTAAAADRSGESKVFAELRKQYFSLRNTDLHCEQLDQWKDLAKELQKFATSSKKTTQDTLFAQFASAALLTSAALATGDKQLAMQADLQITDFVRAKPKNSTDLIFEAEYLLLKLRRQFVGEEEFQALVTEFAVKYQFDPRRLRIQALQEKRGVTLRQASTSKSASGVNKTKTIIIDAGHGGEDEGATGPGNLREKEETLRFAKELQKELAKNRAYDIRLVRTYDEFIPLAERVNFANDFEADLLISLHFNASPDGNTSGFQVYYLDNDHDSASAALLEREGSAFGSGSNYLPRADLMFMISDYIQRAKIERSQQLATLITSNFDKLRKNFNLQNKGIKAAPFYLLVGAHMPCVLVELMHIDNQLDAKLLRNEAFREQLVQQLAGAVENYFREQRNKANNLDQPAHVTKGKREK